MNNQKKKNLGDAIALTADLFVNKTDLAGKPYILHCLAVMNFVGTDDEELAMIAVMHDVLEDIAGMTREKLLEMGYSQRVCDGVYCLSRRADQTEEEYTLQVLSNLDSCKTKVGDITHNSDLNRLKGIREKDFERMKRYHKMYLALKEHLKKH